MSELLKTAQAGKYVGASASYMRKARVNGTGPKFIYITPRMVRYREEDLNEWLNQRVATNTLYASRRNGSTNRKPVKE